MEHQYGASEMAMDFVSEDTKLELTKQKMDTLAHQKFPVKKYNEYTEQFVTIGEQVYEDALRDAYEDLEHDLDNMISKIRNGAGISNDRMAGLLDKVEHFKTFLPT